MSKVEDEFCNRCANHKDCPYLVRDLKRKCITLGGYMDGYQKAIDNAREFFLKNNRGQLYEQFVRFMEE